MSAIEDILETLFHVGVLATTYKIGQDAQKSFADAADRNDIVGMLFSALVCGGSMYAFQYSAQKLKRLIGKQRSLPGFDLRENRYLPR